jgi:hypothetical protein
MQESEASAAWKNIEELNYNLISKYMDTQDKWRLKLGQDLYKQTNLSVDPGMR